MTYDLSGVFKPALPLVLPVGWRKDSESIDGARFVDGPGRMTVIVSGNREADGRRWVHLSVARPERLPSWDDLVFAKRLILGADSTAIQVIPPTQKHVNIHPFCLHLWCCLDGEVLPDFTGGGGSL